MEFLKITNTHSKDALFTSMPRFAIQLQKFSSHAKAAGIKLPAAYSHIHFLPIFTWRYLSSRSLYITGSRESKILFRLGRFRRSFRRRSRRGCCGRRSGRRSGLLKGIIHGSLIVIQRGFVDFHSTEGIYLFLHHIGKFLTSELI